MAVVLGQYRLAKLITFEQETMLLGAVRRLVAERARAARDLSPTNQDENDVSFHDHST